MLLQSGSDSGEEYLHYFVVFVEVDSMLFDYLCPLSPQNIVDLFEGKSIGLCPFVG